MGISAATGQTISDIAFLLQCPMTGLAVHFDETGACWSEDATGQRVAYPIVAGQPVLVDFDRSILDQEGISARLGDSMIGERSGKRSWLKQVLLGQNEVAPGNARALLRHATKVGGNPVILIVGGGTLNTGARELYEAEGARIVSFDIYASAHTDFVADAHAIPLRDGSVHAVWIQAVLEHVLTPSAVADEIWRVLAPGGVVYAETPFLQPVHEEAYDFTRFTESGHRWLFRRFDLIDSGVVKGPGTVLFQAMRYAFGAAVGNRRIGSALAAPFFWLRFLDVLADRRHASDCASGVYFLGRRSERALSPSEMPSFYRGVRR